MIERVSEVDRDPVEVYAYKAKGRGYWLWKSKDPERGVWVTVHFTAALARRYRIKPSGAHGRFLRRDVSKAKWAFEEELRNGAAPRAPKATAPQVAAGASAATSSTNLGAQAVSLVQLFDRVMACTTRKNCKFTLDLKRRVFATFRQSVGDVPAHQLDDRHVVKFLDEIEKDGWRGRPLSSTTLRDYLGYLRSAFRWAHDQGLVARNPFSAIELPERAVSQTPHWSPTEIATNLREHFADSESDAIRFHIAAVFFMGLSPIEWAGADWKHVDVEGERLFVEKVKQKSGKMRRGWVPIPKILVPAFVLRRRDAGPIWPKPGGGHHVRESIQVYRRQIGRLWPGFNFLGLRKSTAAFLSRKIPDAILRDRINRHQSSTGKALECQSMHYEPYDFQMLKVAVDKAFDDQQVLAALVTPRASPSNTPTQTGAVSEPQATYDVEAPPALRRALRSARLAM